MTAGQAGSDQRFLRVLARRDVLALAFGAMIGWGWVILVGTWILRGGSLGAMWGFLVAGGAVVIIALIYGELVSAMPEAGGEHVYSLRALGHGGSFVCTWAIISGYVSVAAFEAVALPTVFEYFVPHLKHVFLWRVAGYDVYLSWVLIGVAGSAIITALNVYGIHLSSAFQRFATLVIVVAGVVLLAAAFSAGSSAYLAPHFIGGAGGISAVMVMAPFMLVGFDVIPQAAEEADVPLRTLGILIVVSVVVAVLWYCMVILTTATLLPPSALKHSSLPAADAAAHAFGDWGAGLLIAGGVAGIVTSWNGFVVGGSRAIFALAESGMLPPFLGKLHPRYRTPDAAVILIGILACVAPLFGRTMLVWIVDAGGFGIVFAYLLVAISFLVLRVRAPEMPRPFRLRHGSVVGGIGILLSLGIALLYMPGSPSALRAQEWIIVGLWVAAGVILYLLAPRHTTTHDTDSSVSE